MISVYVAARWETKDDAAKLRDALAERGIGCTSRWLEEEPSLGDVPEEKKRRVAGMDALEVRRAQALVLWNPPEKHRQGTGGCHVEVGMALALGIPVLVVGGGSNVFHWLPGVTRIRFSGFWPDSDDLMALVAAIKSACVDYGSTWDWSGVIAHRMKTLGNDGQMHGSIAHDGPCGGLDEVFAKYSHEFLLDWQSRNPGAVGVPAVTDTDKIAKDPRSGVERRAPSAASVVDHPPHYNAGGIEVIDVIEAFSLTFATGSAVKYVLRAGRKTPDRIVDLNKALWYLRREIANLGGADEVMLREKEKAREEGRLPGNDVGGRWVWTPDVPKRSG